MLLTEKRRESDSLYEGYYICSSVSTPLFQVSGKFVEFRPLYLSKNEENVVFWPLYFSKNEEKSYFDPYFSSKLGKMYSFDPPFLTLVAFRVDGRWGASLSETWPPPPPPRGPTRYHWTRKTPVSERRNPLDGRFSVQKVNTIYVVLKGYISYHRWICDQWRTDDEANLAGLKASVLASWLLWRVNHCSSVAVQDVRCWLRWMINRKQRNTVRSTRKQRRNRAFTCTYRNS